MDLLTKIPKKKKTTHICNTFPKLMADVLWTVSLKIPRLWPAIKMPSYPGVRRHWLDSQRLWWGKEDLEVSWKDKKTCMKTSSPKTAGKLPEWGIRVPHPSVWRTDEYLADNYNPLKANKSTIVLFQHEVSQAGADAGSFPLIGCLLVRGRHPISCPSPHKHPQA